MLASAATALGATATTERVSVTPGGAEPDASSGEPSVSADGNLVAYSSYATDAVPGVGDGQSPQIYVYDRTTGATKLVSASSSGQPGNDYSEQPAISADGRYVAFDSYATNLAPGAVAFSDVYVKDLVTGELKRASVSASGAAGEDYSSSPSISADGNVVTFSSDAKNLTPVKTKSRRNEFAHYMDSGKTFQVNVSPQGKGGAGDCHKPSVSGDGRLIAFASSGRNLVKGGSKGWQIFVRDMKTKRTTVVSRSSGGKDGNGLSSHPVISGDGRYVAFESKATNLVKGDANTAQDIFLRDLRKGTTKRISVTANGKEANAPSYDAAISNHGGFVAFWSQAGLVKPRRAGKAHVFFYASRGRTRLQQADVNDAGQSANGRSYYPSISADGRFVGFETDARNLVPGRAARQADVYVRGPLH